MMDDQNRNAYDDELWADLKRINDEVKRKTWVRPFEPYATWALAEGLAAMARFEARVAARSNTQLQSPSGLARS